MKEDISLDTIEGLLKKDGYIADRNIALSIYFSLLLDKPLLVEGPAGVGKTQIAKTMAHVLQRDLIRLQCYEGLDASHALYEWNYQRQLLQIKMEERTERDPEKLEKEIFSERFLLKRPLLQAITHDKPPVLLIDEVDRSDEEFESFLLEILSEWQISIPEIGSIRATHKPQVIITSNRVRELSEALRRRCLYLWIDYPDFDKELAIINSKIPDINSRLAEQICHFMEEVRQMKLDKAPGVAETLDWAAALASLHIDHLDPKVVEETLGIVIKDWQDMRHMQDSMSELFEKVGVKSKLD